MIARLLVEGVDDKHVIRHLLRRHGIEDVDIKDKDGFSNLVESLPVELKASDLSRLGVIVDADTSLAQRWQGLRDRLRRYGYPGVPEQPIAEGTIVVEADRQPLGLWVMPDNTIDGILEQFVASLVPAQDSLWPRAREVVRNLPVEQRRFSVVHAPKAEIHTWLAWQEEPGCAMGSAINQRYLSAETYEADAFVGWIRRFLQA